MGEPVQWEMHLQLLIDLLITNGKPDHKPEVIPENHLPVLACNMDLMFMAQACMPRYFAVFPQSRPCNHIITRIPPSF